MVPQEFPGVPLYASKLVNSTAGAVHAFSVDEGESVERGESLPSHANHAASSSLMKKSLLLQSAAMTSSDVAINLRAKSLPASLGTRIRKTASSGTPAARARAFHWLVFLHLTSVFQYLTNPRWFSDRNICEASASFAFRIHVQKAANLV